MQNHKHSPLFVLVTALLLCLCLSTTLSAHSPSDNTVSLLAHAVAAECGDAPFGVQIALASVILNRMEDARFGDTAAQVVWGEDFLTCTSTGRIVLDVEDTVYDRALSAVRCALAGMDPTDGALWYGGGDTGRQHSPIRFGDGGYQFW